MGLSLSRGAGEGYHAAMLPYTLKRLAEIGVRRVSVGSALARVAWGAFIRAARSIVDTGSFSSFSDAATFAELNAVFERATAEELMLGPI